MPGIGELLVSELGAAIGAHVGPGAIGVVVSPRSASAQDGTDGTDGAEGDTGDAEDPEGAAR